MIAVDDTTLELLRGVSTNSLAGLMIKHGGLRTRTILGARPLNPANARFVGPAFTLRSVPLREDLTHRASIVSRTSPLHGTIDRIPPGSVLVIDMRGDTSCGGLGDIMVAALAARGVAALVTDGAMRDGAAIAAGRLPVCCNGVAPAPSNRALLAAGIEEMIGCGGVLVEPGDIVVGDPDGVVVVPRHMAAELALAARELEDVEAWILRQIEAGTPARDLYPPDEAIIARFRAERTNEDQPCRELPVQPRTDAQSAVLPRRDRQRPPWLGRGLCDGREGKGGRRISARHDAASHRPQPVQHPPHRAGAVRRFRHPPLLHRLPLGLVGDRDGAVGHRRQTGRPAALQPPRRRLARKDPRLCQWLVGRAGQHRGGDRARPRGQGGRLHGAEVRPPARPVADLHRPCRRALRHRFRAPHARGARPRDGNPHRAAPPPRPLARHPARPRLRRIRHPLAGGAVPVGQYRPHRRSAPQPADPGGDWRDDLLQGSLCPAARKARRRHPQSRYLRGGRRLGPARHRDAGAAACRGRRAAQQQFHLAGLAATLHVCAVIPNFTIAECFINRLDACDAIALKRINVAQGWAELPTAPGLGIDIDVDRLRQHPYRAYPPRGLRQYWEEFPRQHYAVSGHFAGASGPAK